MTKLRIDNGLIEVKIEENIFYLKRPLRSVKKALQRELITIKGINKKGIPVTEFNTDAFFGYEDKLLLGVIFNTNFKINNKDWKDATEEEKLNEMDNWTDNAVKILTTEILEISGLLDADLKTKKKSGGKSMKKSLI